MSAFVSVESLTTTIDLANSGKMTKKLAVLITGGLSSPAKMPDHAWGTSAKNCITGSKLAAVKGSVCENCYALGGAYMWPNVLEAYDRRLARMNDPRWVEAMVFLIGNDETFRWQDSGDLQSVEQLKNIVAVCRATPETRHWLPTREYKIVRDYQNQGGQIPSNLVIRLSAHMKDAPPPSGYGLPTSTVHTSEAKEPAGSKICRAYERDKRGRLHVTSCDKAGKCRACWDSTVENISYLEH